MNFIRSLLGYHPHDVQHQLLLLKREQEQIEALLHKEQADFEKELEEKQKSAEHIHTKLREALTLERRLIEGKGLL